MRSKHLPFGFKRSQGDLFANEPARNNGIGVADPTYRARSQNAHGARTACPPAMDDGRRASIKSFSRKWRTGCQI